MIVLGQMSRSVIVWGNCTRRPREREREKKIFFLRTKYSCLPIGSNVATAAAIAVANQIIIFHFLSHFMLVYSFPKKEGRKEKCVI